MDRFKAWRSAPDKWLHVLVFDAEDRDCFDKDVPDAIRHLGPWAGSKEGEVRNLRPHYRQLLQEQRFVVIHRRPVEFEPTV